MSAVSARLRLDQLLVDRGLCPSRARARDAIARGTVTVNGAVETRPGRRVAAGATLALGDPAAGYVSRAALKLIAGLDAFGLDPGGLVCLDLGASTGGFTQVLLERGASRVHAVDVGHGQLAPVLAQDPRVVVHEGVNARALDASTIGEPVAAIVCDVSFISLALALPPALSLVAPNAFLIALVKPQFEVGRRAIGRGGIVRDGAATRAALDRIAALVAGSPGWRVAGTMASPVRGGDGNQEFLLGAVKRG